MNPSRDEDEARKQKALALVRDFQSPHGAAKLHQLKVLIKAAFIALALLLALQLTLTYTVFKPACAAYVLSIEQNATAIEYSPPSGTKTSHSSFSGYCKYKMTNGEDKRKKFGEASSWRGVLSVFYRFGFGYLISLFIVFLLYIKPQIKQLDPDLKNAFN